MTRSLAHQPDRGGKRRAERGPAPRRKCSSPNEPRRKTSPNVLPHRTRKGASNERSRRAQPHDLDGIMQAPGRPDEDTRDGFQHGDWSPAQVHMRRRAMDDRQHMRASDADRQEVVDRLAAALEEGRLKMDEYAERMGLAYRAVTYGDLAALSADLPQAGPVTKREAAPPAAAPLAAAPRGVVADLPAALKVLWTIWLAAVAINLIVWVLVSGQ